MEWFTGGVGEAIAAAKAKKAIFAVFVKGKQLVTLPLSMNVKLIHELSRQI